MKPTPTVMPNHWLPIARQAAIWFSHLGMLLLLGNTCNGQDTSASSNEGLVILQAAEDATTAAIAKAERSVVSIARVRKDRSANDRRRVGALQLDPMFAFEDPGNDPNFVPTFYGSGVVIDDEGFIVTCAHVLDDPRLYDYFVWLDRQSYPARVVGKPAQVFAADPFSDLAVLKIDAEGLQAIEFADPSTLRKGKFVLALGNPDAIARDGTASASWGIVSNLSRIAPAEGEEDTRYNKETLHQYGTLIQTDAKLNFGTSGGALVNLQGEMLGLTTSLAALSGYEHSAGYAIASDELFQRVVDTLKLGQVPEYGFLGVQPEDLRLVDRRSGRFGAKVAVVLPGLPGDEAGIESDDVIIQVGDVAVQNRNDLFRELSRTLAGETVELRVQRQASFQRVPQILTLTARLSKKFVSTTRQAYELRGAKPWRGLQIEYATAIPSDPIRGGLITGSRNMPNVALLSVEPGTPAWNAGLRPGFGIEAVNEQPITTPQEFRDAIALAESTGGDKQSRGVEIRLQVVGDNFRARTIVIPAPEPAANSVPPAGAEID